MVLDVSMVPVVNADFLNVSRNLIFFLNQFLWFSYNLLMHNLLRLSLLQSSYHKEVRAEGEGASSGRPVIFANGAETSAWPPADGYRERVLAGSRTLERTGESLHRATQVAVETEVVGGAIIEDLGSQRDALERTRNRLIETDLELSKSRRILQKMYLNVISNKIILLCIILSELGILGGLIYWKFFSK